MYMYFAHHLALIVFLHLNNYNFENSFVLCLDSQMNIFTFNKHTNTSTGRDRYG